MSDDHDWRRRARYINALRASRINSATEEPPAYICVECGLDGDCRCEPEPKPADDESERA